MPRDPRPRFCVWKAGDRSELPLIRGHSIQLRPGTEQRSMAFFGGDVACGGLGDRCPRETGKTGDLENAFWDCIFFMSWVMRGRLLAEMKRRNDMHEIQLAGTREELGRAYGEIIAERKLNRWWRAPSEQKLAFVRACEETIAEHAPGYLDELRGLADASHSDYDLVLSNMIVTYFADIPSCNVVAMSGSQTARGRTIFVRNHDWIDEDKEAITCFRTALEDGLRHIAFGFTDPGRYDGMNEDGLAIGGSSIPFYTGTPKPGLRMNVVTRYVLDTCPDVMSAVAFMKRIPHMEGFAYLLADESGRVARVEVAPEGVDVTITENGALYTVNRFQSDPLASLSEVPDDNMIHTYQHRIEAWAEKHMGRLDIPSAVAFCSDHDEGICDHGCHMTVPGGTIYSWVGALGQGEIHLAHGRPCENAHRLYKLEPHRPTRSLDRSG